MKKISKRKLLYYIFFFVLVLIPLAGYVQSYFQLDWHIVYIIFVLFPVIGLAFYDRYIGVDSVTRLYPVLGHIRYIFENMGIGVRNYIVNTDTDGTPLNREQRSMVWQRANKMPDELSWGTRYRVDQVGYIFAYHSLAPKEVDPNQQWVMVGSTQCKKAYKSSRLNISAMSFGAISDHAIAAFNTGAKLGGFAHNTGEGGISRYHLKPGGDLIFQLGTAYFGCRDEQGHFDADKFAIKAGLDAVKMIEVKLSQGAKPSHGGILPGAKVTREIAEIRGIPVGQDSVSPPAHTAFSSPDGLLRFLDQLRELSGGKPVGFKLCVGRRVEFMAICKAMVETGSLPDFISVDGAEGGTGAAPKEYSDRLGAPINESLVFVDNCLKGIGVRDKVIVICSGKVVSGFDMITKMALGADICNSARAMMLAIGCVQALRCHTNTCPSGVATQDKSRSHVINIQSKGRAVADFHTATLQSFLGMAGAMGCTHISELGRDDIYRYVAVDVRKSYAQLYPQVEAGAFLSGKLPQDYEHDWEQSDWRAF